ncbi:hypothetical protein ONS96_005652 [Cadophora gregata f. sp. sojae]|nr:hypothetical protein ONS96_005652 [Cadophora gregata f. sp. sojae]
MTSLCKKCEVLSFYDSQQGGYEHEDSFGNKVLRHAWKSQRMFFSFDVQLDYEHHDQLPDMPRMAASAEAGCRMCGLLRAAILEDLRIRAEWEPITGSGCSLIIKELSYEFTESFRLHDDVDEHDLTEPNPGRLVDDCTEHLVALFAGLRIFALNQSEHRHTVVFRPEALSGSCASWLNLRPTPWPDALYPENISMMKREISHCVKKCSHSKNGGFIPTRLVDLRVPDAPCLIEMGRHNSRKDLLCEDIRYAALSYCWGPPSEAISMLKTERKSLQNRIAGFALVEMPRVFQDAISVCHKLSIHFLWIDALCIVQDDEKDWEQEAPLMGDVYESALVTIIPLAAHTCHDGFLSRPYETVVEIPFQSMIRPMIHGTFVLRHIPQSAHNHGNLSIVHGVQYMEIMRSTWNQRGWICQEEAMSSRCLFFGQSSVFYPCVRWTRSENDPRRYRLSGSSFQKNLIIEGTVLED